MRSTHRQSVLRIAAPAGLSAALLLAAMTPAGALERGAYSIEVLVDGKPLREHRARSTIYVEALEGHDYSIRLRNDTSRRVAVALSVDGLNVIDAKTTSTRRASKWILDPHQTITLDGWQTGSSVARRFFFTTEDSSYGAWLGKTSNLGILSAAFFRERVPDPAPITRPHTHDGNREKSRKKDPAGRFEQEQSADAPSAPAAKPLPDDFAATGIGEEIEHRVRRVHFDAEASPTMVMEVRYEYRDALVRLGVLPYPGSYRDNPLERRESARGFEEIDFAPDPYRR